MDLIEFKEKMGYGELWNAFLSEGYFNAQLDTFLKTKDEDAEHYKWASYKYILKTVDLSNVKNWKAFVSLIDSDTNEFLYKGAIKELYQAGVINKDLIASSGSERIKSVKL